MTPYLSRLYGVRLVALAAETELPPFTISFCYLWESEMSFVAA